MKRIVKHTAIVFAFIFITVMAVSALNESDINAISDNVLLLNDIQSELSSSSSSRSVSRVISSAIKQLNDAVAEGGQSCVSRLDVIFSKLDRAVGVLASRSCNGLRTKNCVPKELVDRIIVELQNTIDDLRRLAALDENGNGTPDVCDSDPDGDGVLGKNDNCPLVSNPEQKDVDGNKIGDACDLFFCCEDSSLTVPLSECDKKTIKSCSEEGNVVIGCLAPKTRKSSSKTGSRELISSSPILLNQVSGQNVINFGTGAMPSTIMINTGFFPFNNSQALLTGFSDFACNDLDVTFTPPTGFPGGAFEIGPAANSTETGPRTTFQINGDMSSIITLSNFPIIDPLTGQPFSPQMGDQLGLSLFTQNQVFANSFFNVFADLDFDGECHSPLNSSGGNASSSGLFDPFPGGIVIEIPGTSSGGGVVGNTSSGAVANTSSGAIGTSSGSFVSMLQNDLNMSTVPVTQGGMAYMAGTYDCDDFAHDLGVDLMGKGYDTTFTAIWRDNGMTGHAVTDIHPASSSGIVFVEPQNGMIIDLDENMDGMVGYRDGTHSDATMNTEGMSEIEVYMDRDAAAMAGVPID